MHNKFARTASFTLPGDPLLLAGQTVRVAGWAAFDGKYLVSRAVHTLGTGGYTTDVELQKVLGV